MHSRALLLAHFARLPVGKSTSGFDASRALESSHGLVLRVVGGALKRGTPTLFAHGFTFARRGLT